MHGSRYNLKLIQMNENPRILDNSGFADYSRYLTMQDKMTIHFVPHRLNECDYLYWTLLTTNTSQNSTNKQLQPPPPC